MSAPERGFTMVDLVVAIGVAGVLSAVGVPAVRMATSDNALQRCRYNLRAIGQGEAMYREDFAGQMSALSWKTGMIDPMLGRSYAADVEAQAYQAVYILRRRAGLNENQAPVPSSWIPSFLFSHLALVDYLGLPLPSSTFVCPLDARRVAYVNGDFGQLPPSSGDGSSGVWRAPFTSTYSQSVYQWSPSRQTTVNVSGFLRNTAMAGAVSSNVDTPSTDPLGFLTDGSFRPRQGTDVAFPSQKVALSDTYARHNGGPRYYAYLTATQDLQFYDGSVRTYRTDATNPGWNPNSQSARKNMQTRFSFTKFADFWGGLDNNAQAATFAAGWYRWTRGGLLGWDVPRLSSMVGKPPSANVVENELNTSSGAW